MKTSPNKSCSMEDPPSIEKGSRKITIHVKTSACEHSSNSKKNNPD
jgi:hypothetical protein